MAGSYDHIRDKQGNLLTNTRDFTDMIENLGDAYEAIEEMYGMIWWLAERVEGPDVKEIVEQAWRRYQDGLAFARRTNGDG